MWLCMMIVDNNSESLCILDHACSAYAVAAFKATQQVIIIINNTTGNLRADLSNRVSKNNNIYGAI